jgi:AraC-like DNA-binding protein
MPIHAGNHANAMLIGRERLCYSGIYATPKKPRSMGAFVIYVAPSADFDIAANGQSWTERSIFALKPFTDHHIRARCGRIIKICIEAETMATADMQFLFEEISDPVRGARLAAHLRDAHREIKRVSGFNGFSVEDFDRHFFSRSFPMRPVDTRLRQVFDIICEDVRNEILTADECAQISGLSVSRFLHLFKENASVSFRAFRSWKQARRFLDYANRPGSLTHVALDLGYPDSSHFSRSIRRIFGLQPRSIREWLRELQVATGEGYTLRPR